MVNRTELETRALINMKEKRFSCRFGGGDQPQGLSVRNAFASLEEPEPTPAPYRYIYPLL